MKIQIPEPCHEDLNKMSPQEKGRFCDSCQKVVIDFSAMTDTEIINYFQNVGSQKTCGLFSKTQVNRTLQPQKEKIETPRRTFFFKELAAASVAFFLTSTTAKSQNDTTLVEYNQKIETDSLENIAPPFAINGKVVNGIEIVSDAIISIKGTEHKTISLENGIFSFLISEDTLKSQDRIILVAEYEGLETKEVEVIISSINNQFVFIDFAESMEKAVLERVEYEEPIILVPNEKLGTYYFESEIFMSGFVRCWIPNDFITGDIGITNIEPKLDFKLDADESKKNYKENIKKQDPNNQSKKTVLISLVSKWYTRIKFYQSIKDLMKKTFS